MLGKKVTNPALTERARYRVGKEQFTYLDGGIDYLGFHVAYDRSVLSSAGKKESSWNQKPQKTVTRQIF